MVRAVDPKKVNSLSDVITAYKRKAQNIRLNLDKGVFEVHNAKDEVVKTIPIGKGYDAAYVITRSEKSEDIQSSVEFLAAQRQLVATAAGEKESEFANIQDDLLTTIETWKASAPGASRAGLAEAIGRLQHELAQAEAELRAAQYKYRAAIPVEAKRRIYVPASNDDRNVPFPVYRLDQYSNLSKDRVVPIA